MRTRHIPARKLRTTHQLIETVNGRRHLLKVCEVTVTEDQRTRCRVRHADGRVSVRPVELVGLTGGKSLEKPGFWRPSDQVQVQAP